jgi:hypothetical protein
VGEAEPDLTILTDAFVEARYSGGGIEAEKLSSIKESWRRVRHALRARSAVRSPDSDTMTGDPS